MRERSYFRSATFTFDSVICQHLYLLSWHMQIKGTVDSSAILISTRQSSVYVTVLFQTLMNVVLEATTVNSGATMSREVTAARVTQAIH